MFSHFRSFECDLLHFFSSPLFSSLLPRSRLIKQQRPRCLYYPQTPNCCHSAGLIRCRPSGSTDVSPLYLKHAVCGLEAAGPGDDPGAAALSQANQRWMHTYARVQCPHVNNEASLSSLRPLLPTFMHASLPS